MGAAGLAAARVDAESFTRPLSRCDLGSCHGFCCSSGVHLRREEGERIPLLAKEHASFFASLGLRLPEEVVVDVEDAPGRKATVTKAHPFRSTTAGFPDHFPETACVFHLDDGRCGLQVLSVELGEHPWHYKPAACWLHPVITPGNPSRGWRVTLPDEVSDPEAGPDAPGFTCVTGCGRTDPEGAPAHVVLEEELRFLGEWIGRDVVGEIRQALEPHEQPDGGAAGPA
jgi:hypothetical protein